MLSCKGKHIHLSCSILILLQNTNTHFFLSYTQALANTMSLPFKTNAIPLFLTETSFSLSQHSFSSIGTPTHNMPLFYCHITHRHTHHISIPLRSFSHFSKSTHTILLLLSFTSILFSIIHHHTLSFFYALATSLSLSHSFFLLLKIELTISRATFSAQRYFKRHLRFKNVKQFSSSLTRLAAIFSNEK